MNLPVYRYLDHAATTPCDPLVLDAMLPYFADKCGNPSSAWHRSGRTASAAVEQARDKVGGLLGCESSSLVFTSGATEGNNLALLGISRGMLDTGRRKLVATTVEHKSVLGPLEYLARGGFQIELLPVDGDGRIDIATAERIIDDRTLLVAVQLANQEVGSIQPLAEVVELAHRAGAMVHCDAAQAAGKVGVHAVQLGADSLVICAHKMYGPTGVAALFLTRGIRRILEPLAFGGGQEGGLRPGTPNVPGIVGFGVSAELASQALDSDSKRLSSLRDRFEQLVLESMPGAVFNGAGAERLAGFSSLSLPDVDADALLANVPALGLSTGSACDSGAWSPSHVLMALGLNRDIAGRTIRVSFGRGNTMQDAEVAAWTIVDACRDLSAKAGSRQ